MPANRSGNSEDAEPGPDREALFRQFGPLVGSLLRRYGTTPELRKDLPGEIYYQFARLVERYDATRGIPIEAYLAGMLRQCVFNHVRDYWRAEERFVAIEDDEALEALLPPSAGPDALTEAWDTEGIRAALPRAISRLPQRQRLVVVWRYYEGRSFEEIAERLDVKPVTARSLLRHGIAGLRRHFAGTDP